MYLNLQPWKEKCMSIKNILIISYLFAPNNEIGAVRPTKLAKYLTIKGFNVSVICIEGQFIEDATLKADAECLKNITRIHHSSLYNGLMKCITLFLNRSRKSGSGNATQRSGTINKSRFKKWFSVMIRQSLDILTAYDFYFCVKRVSKNLDLNKYDLVFSTYGPLGSHLVGRYFQRKSKRLKWIADFRDPMDITMVHDKKYNKFTYNNIFRKMQNSFCWHSDYITAVSEGYLNQITNGKYLDKSSVVTNGYDLSDFEAINKRSQNLADSKKLTFIYTGRLYEGKRDLSPLFRAISELEEEGEINKDYVQFFYAGNDEQYLTPQALQNKCEKIVKYFGFVPRTISLELQSQSHILVVATWNEQGYEGVLPGKFLEYMLFKKPIIAIVTGGVKDSEIAQIIKKCRLGACYEEIQHEKHHAYLKAYILKQYTCLKNTGNVDFNPSLDDITQYNYINIADKIIDILGKVCENKV